MRETQTDHAARLATFNGALADALAGVEYHTGFVQEFSEELMLATAIARPGATHIRRALIRWWTLRRDPARRAIVYTRYRAMVAMWRNGLLHFSPTLRVYATPRGVDRFQRLVWARQRRARPATYDF